MSFYDIIILVVLFGAMIFGYMKGLAWQIASVAAVVVSYFAAVQFRGRVAQYVSAEPPFNNIAAMLIIFVASSLAIWLAYAYINKSIEKAELDGFNRQMGALVGSVLGVLLVMVITVFSVSLLGKSAHDSIFESKLGPYVIRGISMAQAFVPDEFQASLDPHFEKFYEQIGYDSNQPPGTYLQGSSVPGGSQYTTGQTFNPSSQPSYAGHWQTLEPGQPTQNNYQANNNYQPNNYQPNTNYQANQTQTAYPPAQGNPGTNYPPQQTNGSAQQQPSGLELKLDAQDLLNGAQWLRNNVTNPSGQ